jgi:hypothetical protein
LKKERVSTFLGTLKHNLFHKYKNSQISLPWPCKCRIRRYKDNDKNFLNIHSIHLVMLTADRKDKLNEMKYMRKKMVITSVAVLKAVLKTTLKI